MKGTVISVENQYAVIKVPIDFGSLLAELTIRWHPEITYEALSRKLQAMTDNPENVPLLDLLSSPDKSQNTSELKAEPVFLPETNERQKEAIQKSLSNRITFVWGPPDSGKTKTLAQIAYNLIRAGKRIHLCSGVNTSVDELLHALLECYQICGGNVQELTRYGQHTFIDNPHLTEVTHEAQVSKMTAETCSADDRYAFPLPRTEI